MNITTRTKWTLALGLLLGLQATSLRAQIFTAPLQASTTGTNPVDFEFRADGTLIALGNLGVGSLLTADQGAGVRMLWFPSLAAFRAGSVTGTDWDAVNIGSGSAAFGTDTFAPGSGSFATGDLTQANGSDAVAMGTDAKAFDDDGVALGGYTTAYQYCDTALGFQSVANGGEATALGSWTNATGPYSMAMGSAATASGNYATAMGNTTLADSFNATAVGTFNVGGGTPDTWIDTDPLFEVGNGGDGAGNGNPSATTTADALVIYKNGNAVLQGTLDIAPGGDIPMFTGE